MSEWAKQKYGVVWIACRVFTEIPANVDSEGLIPAHIDVWSFFIKLIAQYVISAFNKKLNITKYMTSNYHMINRNINVWMTTHILPELYSSIRQGAY